MKTVDDVEKQMARIETILSVLEAPVTAEKCAGMIGIIDEAFKSIGCNTGRDHGLREYVYSLLDAAD